MFGLERDAQSDSKDFTSSLMLERRFAIEDILSSIAYVKMLIDEKIVEPAEGDAIISSLQEAKSKIEKGEFLFEDPRSIFPNLERYVLESCGLSGGKMFTGRSKHDNLMADVRMACRGEILGLRGHLLNFQGSLSKAAWKDAGAVMPSFSQAHASQLITLGHYLLYQLDTLSRDMERFSNLYRRVNLCSMGAGLGGGSSFDLDRLEVRESLAFEGLVENTLDALNSNDFILETYSSLAILMTHLSRFAEDLLLFSNEELRLIRLSEEYASDLSTQPQKSPDVLEMIRAKSGTVYGAMTQAFTVMKGVSTGYSRDVQEVYALLFDTFGTVNASVQMLEGIVRTMKADERRMLELANKRHVCSSDLAELLMRKGISFKNANAIVGTIVKECAKNNKQLNEVDPEFLEVIILRQLKYEVKIKQSELKDAVDPQKAIFQRKSKGGPNPKEVKRMVANRELVLERFKKEINKEKAAIRKALDRLE